MSSVSDTTTQRISTITAEQILARLNQAERRIRIAAQNMSDRYNKRGAGPYAPTDMDAIPLPPAPMATKEIKKVVSVVDYYADFNASSTAIVLRKGDSRKS